MKRKCEQEVDNELYHKTLRKNAFVYVTKNDTLPKTVTVDT